MPPKTYTEIAVDRLIQCAGFLVKLFEENSKSESNRQRLQDSAPGYITELNTSLTKLTANSIIAAPLKVPQGAFNTFVSTWKNGTGDLTRSNNAAAEFGRLLTSAKPAIDTAIANQRATGSPEGSSGTALTRQDIQRSQAIAKQANALNSVFMICATAHSDLLATKVKEQVTTVDQLMTALIKSPATQVQAAKVLWQEFIKAYNSGKGITLQTQDVLRKFMEAMNTMAHA